MTESRAPQIAWPPPDSDPVLAVVEAAWRFHQVGPLYIPPDPDTFNGWLCACGARRGCDPEAWAGGRIPRAAGTHLRRAWRQAWMKATGIPKSAPRWPGPPPRNPDPPRAVPWPDLVPGNQQDTPGSDPATTSTDQLLPSRADRIRAQTTTLLAYAHGTVISDEHGHAWQKEFGVPGHWYRALGDDHGYSADGLAQIIHTHALLREGAHR